MTPHVLKIWNIDGADNYTKIDTMDIITNYLLLYFSKEFSSIRKIHVDIKGTLHHECILSSECPQG